MQDVLKIQSRPAGDVKVGEYVQWDGDGTFHEVIAKRERGSLIVLDLGEEGNEYAYEPTEPVWVTEGEDESADDALEMARAYGEAPLDPDDGYYYSGTGEWSGDDSYIDYLNNGG